MSDQNVNLAESHFQVLDAIYSYIYEGFAADISVDGYSTHDSINRKKNKYRREGKGRRCSLGGQNLFNSLPC